MAPGPPPPGGDVDRSAVLIGVSCALASLSLIFVTLRIYCRVFVTRNMWWDDWTIIIVMIWTLSFTSLWVVYGHLGGTRHFSDLLPSNVEPALKVNLISQTLCALGLMSGKISVGLLIMRIGVPNVRLRYFLYFCMASQFLIGSLAIIFYWNHCSPVSKLWNIEVPGKCWSLLFLSAWTIMAASYNAFIDIVLAAIPVSVILTLQMPLHKKISLSLVMSVGIFAAICGIIKASKVPAAITTTDVTWNDVPLLIWSCVEVNVVAIAACVPALRPLYLILFRLPGAEHYREKSRRKRSYQRHPSPSDEPYKRRGPDTELMSLDTDWNVTTVRGADGDGEGLVKQADGTIKQTVEMEVRYDTEPGSADWREGRQSRSRQLGW